MQEIKLFNKILKREANHFFIYSNLAKRSGDLALTHEFRAIANIEKRHMSLWLNLLKVCGGKPKQNFNGLLPRSILAVCVLFGPGFTRGFMRLYENIGFMDIFKAIELAPQKYLKNVVGCVFDEMYTERVIYQDAKTGSFFTHIRDVVFGMNDGLVEVLASVAGLVGIYKSNIIAAIAGLIVGISGTLSMSVGAYLSSSSEKDVYFSNSSRLNIEISKILSRVQKELSIKTPLKPDEDLTEVLKALKIKKSPLLRLLKKVVDTKTMLKSKETHAPFTKADFSPLKDAAYVGVFYLLGAVIPLISFFVGNALQISAFTDLGISIFLTSITIIIVTALVAVNSHKNVVNDVMRYLILSLSVTAVTFIIGDIISIYLHVAI